MAIARADDERPNGTEVGVGVKLDAGQVGLVL